MAMRMPRDNPEGPTSTLKGTTFYCFADLGVAMGCVAPAPLPTATPVLFLAIQLDIRIDPKDAATFMLKLSPLGKGGYSQGMVVTIDILPKQGWQVEEWVGPVFNIDGKTANIRMDSSQTVAVRLKSTTPATATPTPVPTTTPRPTESPFPTATPMPTYTPRPTPTARVIFVTPTPTPTPRPTPTPNADSYSDKGYAFYEDGTYQQAINEFTTAIRLNPSYTYAYRMRGSAYVQLGQHERAIQDYDKAIQLDASIAAIYVISQALGWLADAIDDGTRADRSL